MEFICVNSSLRGDEGRDIGIDMRKGNDANETDTQYNSSFFNDYKDLTQKLKSL